MTKTQYSIILFLALSLVGMALEIIVPEVHYGLIVKAYCLVCFVGLMASTAFWLLTADQDDITIKREHLK